MRVYKVYENYGGSPYEVAMFYVQDKAKRYCNLLNEPKDSNHHYVLEEILISNDDWNESEVLRFLEVYANDDDDEPSITEDIMMTKSKSSLLIDDYDDFGD